MLNSSKFQQIISYFTMKDAYKISKYKVIAQKYQNGWIFFLQRLIKLALQVILSYFDKLALEPLLKYTKELEKAMD